MNQKLNFLDFDIAFDKSLELATKTSTVEITSLSQALGRVISKDIVLYENKPTILVSFIKGKITKKITLKELEDITLFLSKLHKVKNIRTDNENIYSKNYFEKKERD